MPGSIARETEKLKRRLLILSADVEELYLQATRSLGERDLYLAEKVIAFEERIDHEEIDLEEECLKVLALHQPVANDLRFIVSVLKIVKDIERIADLAVNIARQVAVLHRFPGVMFPCAFSDMAQKVFAMVKKSLKSLVDLDLQEAREVLLLGNEVHAMQQQNCAGLIQTMREEPQHLEALIASLVIFRHLERSAELTTHVARDVYYLVNGDLPERHSLGKMAEFRSPVARESAA